MTEHKNIQNTQDNLDLQGDSWVDREFSHPTRTIRLATSFSGIGAIEYAFKRLNLNVEIVFAGDIDANCKKAYFANYKISEEIIKNSQNPKKVSYTFEMIEGVNFLKVKAITQNNATEEKAWKYEYIKR